MFWDSLGSSHRLSLSSTNTWQGSWGPSHPVEVARPRVFINLPLATFGFAYSIV